MGFSSSIHYAFMFRCTAFPVWHGPCLMPYWVFLGVTWYASSKSLSYQTYLALSYLICSGEITPSSRHEMHPTRATILPNKGHGMIFPTKSFCHVWYFLKGISMRSTAMSTKDFPYFLSSWKICSVGTPFRRHFLAWCHHQRTSTCGYDPVEFERDSDRRGQSNLEGYRLWSSSRGWMVDQTHIRGTKRGRSSGRCSHILLFEYGHRN